MARNIEVKARVEDTADMLTRIAVLSDEGPVEIAQDDTFFRCDSGRLKLRAFADGTGELIFYRRANLCGPKESFYFRTPIHAPALLRESLSLAYGHAGRVMKQRKLFMVGRTRIHFDQVAHLGTFIELEVVLNDGEAAEAGVTEARALMEKLKIETHQLVDEAYVDLLWVGPK